MAILLGQCGLVLCRLLAQVATGLAFFLVCTLILCKTKKRILALDNIQSLAFLVFSCAPAGVVAIWLDVWLLLTRLQLAGQNVSWPSFFAPAVLASTASTCLWLCSTFLGLLFWFYQSKLFRLPVENSFIAFAFALAFSFFMAMTFQFYSFDRPPEGISRLQVFALALQAAFHLFFRSLSPAGMVALVVLLRKQRVLQSKEANLYQAVCWCAFWAVVGSVPYLLNKWGTLLGYFLRGDLPARMMSEFIALSFLSCAIFCFALLFVKKLAQHRQKLVLGGIGLYLCAELSLPVLSFLQVFSQP